jgi:transposase
LIEGHRADSIPPTGGRMAMMGPRQEAQPALFYEFSLEDHVPQDHLLRSIDRFVDLSSIRAHLADFYSHTGRPSVDPELLIRMLLVGYCFGIRSERRLCEEVHLNLAYRWFCRLDLTDRSRITPPSPRTAMAGSATATAAPPVRETVARCIAEGLVSGQRMAVDASLIEADANKQNSTPKEEWDAARIDPADAPRAVREYLDTLDEAAFGAASEVQPKFTSHSDPASQWTGGAQGAGILQLFRQLPDRHGSWRHRRCRGDPVDPAGRGRLDQDHAGPGEGQVRSASRTPDRGHRLRHRADAGLAGRPQDRPAHPGLRQVRAQRRHLDPRRGFEWDAENDQYICPEGHELKQFRRNYSDPNRGPTGKGVAKYRGLKLTCQACPSKPRCCPNMDFRSITREEHEDARQVARDIAKTSNTRSR